ncbi:MAG: hypothetical protein H6509_05405 [Bryobacterales bacterium]|nr:hypothetical protein [Acidobacteriota bacterium]MCB9384029.1 hypothetical protein [Bryobacterales bacterium]
MSAREKLRVYVESLPEEQLDAALRALESMAPRDPVLQMLLNAPEDDEPLSEEELRAHEEGLEAIARGDMVPWEKVREELA